MRQRLARTVTIVVVATLFGILPGCVEVWLLNLATPFLLNQ